ncbi:unnamed protein product [Pedinophyceae sp. YPF-701]|nr:unnamed protein product [Pedinophyceae sp. YPF-701]
MAPVCCFSAAVAAARPHIGAMRLHRAHAAMHGGPQAATERGCGIRWSLGGHRREAAARGRVVAKALDPVGGVIAASTVYAGCLVVCMAVAPLWKPVLSFVRKPTCALPLAMAYAALLAVSWEPDTLQLILPGSLEEGLKGWNPQFFPTVETMSTLFARPLTAASLWLHILTVNVLAARWALVEAVEWPLHTRPEAEPHGSEAASHPESLKHPCWHTVLLCGTLGPVGVAVHFATAALWTWLRARQAASSHPASPGESLG